MRSRIVLKLFFLTSFLCLLITGTIYTSQTIFFKQYYANRKVQDLKTHIRLFEKQLIKNSENNQVVQQLEQDFYQKHNTWLTTLDQNGNIKTAKDFYVTIESENVKNPVQNKKITVPLYHLIDVENVKKSEPLLSSGDLVDLYTIEKNHIEVPFYLYSVQNNSYWVNILTWTKIAENFPIKNVSKNPNEVLSKLDYLIKYNIDLKISRIKGKVIDVQFPERNDVSSIIYANSLFMDRINEFQTSLLLNKNNKYDTFQILDYEQNDIKYKLFIDPVTNKNGEINYIFSMASLQPVDEAVQMVKDYFVYIIAFVLILTLLASFYYSLKIARPLLKINNITRKIANLDFSERIEYYSKDEIGDLSQNINFLSNTLHSHIKQLRLDIEKEKQLENTRKEFISGVSHELKTPLSIMKSCISILKDGVATHKKDYYFEAMEKEVDKMDLLIVDMLELAKYESGTYKMKMEPFFIDKIIDYICNQLSLEVEKKQLTVHKDIDPIEVIGNQHRIEQVMTNFLTNAIRYTPENEHIYISTIEEDEHVKVCVENKGAYIPNEQLEKVWDRFYRGDTSRHRSEGSTGLGLAITKNILELHGMQYGVMNTSGGVLFYFYLKKI
ncbi:HAMP domain-containing sensor histidine kinase [Neobacillus sp. YX16]|uniref:sensor histidine kinase n=1 Tax=Neobacillus sp. YX16 TaxID=3047874 RepID=UPI0024C32B57|nr:HAMP domain-containing sensor histidine kinase [Neobacillus sp. YX16]WHZ04998.1 HAMP domain-containing sensor histidine kinase [Neobacillus sp. YX16]